MDILIVGAASAVAAISACGLVCYCRLVRRDLASSLRMEKAKLIHAVRHARHLNYESIKLRQGGNHIGSARLAKDRVRRMREARRFAARAMTLTLKLARSRSTGVVRLAGRA
ncbi:hypothetical protein SAMN05216605_121130 [Pseudomonas abietaniphila]|uniref:Uncharacterized protein n=1 Tax=Pseudomonas abietaniphila TaxID=89065 RepID=A0A1G8R1G0_9PSED|nr:hypothetical protein SAMN05216605_121130 [Pseudomonas abietaniphila]